MLIRRLLDCELLAKRGREEGALYDPGQLFHSGPIDQKPSRSSRSREVAD